MNILFVLENYYPNIGGVETLFKTLVERLAAQGHQVTVLTTQLEKDHPRREDHKNLLILRYPFWNRYFFTFFAFFPIVKIIRRADIVHTTSYNAALPAFFAAFFFQKKIIVTFHEVWSDLWFRLPFMSGAGRYLHWLFEQFLLRLPFHRFVAVSENTANALVKNGVRKSRIVVNYNGINYTEFKPRKELPQNDKFTYTFFGRLGASKGLNIIIDAAAIMKRQYPNTIFQFIIPTSPTHFFKEIMDLLEEKDLLAYTQLAHDLPFEELKARIKASDCVVIPSYSEGFCYAAVETMAMNVPIISSDQAALKEVISGKFIKMKTHDANGLVVALEKAMQGQWEQTPLRKYELSETVQRYQAIYEQLL